MYVVDIFIVNVAIPSIRADLNASTAQIESVIALYQIAYASMVITGGRLGDIYGARRLFLIGLVGFTATSLACGLAPTGSALVLARLAQGLTAALMVPQVLATIHNLFPDAARSRAFAIFGIAGGLGGVVGFIVGGWLVTLNPYGLSWHAFPARASAILPRATSATPIGPLTTNIGTARPCERAGPIRRSHAAAAALAGCAVEIGKAGRGFQNPGSEQEANQRPACEVPAPASVISR